MSRFADLLPPLWPEEYEALKADIAERGVLVPIEVDEDGEILDGAHRARAAAELGIAPPARIVRRGLSEEGKRAHALALNIHRRQLMAAQRRELVARLRAEGLSVRRIASTVGVPKSTVADDLQVSGSGHLAGDPAGSPAVVTGVDGKAYPATRPRSEAWRAEDLLGSAPAPATSAVTNGATSPAPPTAEHLFTEAEVKAIFAKGPSDWALRDLGAMTQAAMSLRQNEAGLAEYLAEHDREDREEALYELSEYVEWVIAFVRARLQPGLKVVK